MKYRLIKIKNEWLMKGEKMKAIAMFNNKGGVGKTTLTCNLSAYIARTGKKVMLIDADPQCNSTIYCFTDDLFSKVYYDKKGFTIYDVIKPVNQGIGYVKNVEVYNLEKFGFDFCNCFGGNRRTRTFRYGGCQHAVEPDRIFLSASTVWGSDRR